ncbi:N(4)-(Beta-N-acetylglucosaminyl)-L-asparaginase-like [Phymastichus coffea]|uniref:N(4)-(Beta-N-acetylglucosaminyl)-L-asparaginase- like n=1 Tax=Phymastichus coffea TaxID=108790 RepID=UPI00273CCA3D|nr:N(4)-(Beta-N-acetylglucosaminyl)-L-asparaginase-like [Phymastichus coffea]XP_058790734.1 N(4)-(Beta-N-acetylglucosaminyl)-L-asparaginase-like [Phymastichus coffea]XP_058790736.1 N(4)-(Beta-N-acetylglucosaminyl)-L-asparaginase-like [Phymastichus coffea]
MAVLKLLLYLVSLNILLSVTNITALNKFIPLVINTWNFPNANRIAWNTIYNDKGSAIDAIEKGCSYCEDAQCDNTVGYGGSPDENGETALDAMIMDGTTMDVGAIGNLRNVKNAISVARHVLENTAHTLIVGSHATEFALKVGFHNETLQTEQSYNIWKKWRNNNCQPNFWRNVIPNPKASCGPYHPKKALKRTQELYARVNENNHDTIGMIAIDTKGHIAAGTSTNGLKYKIPGRVGDSPIAGAGAYADQEVGAAAATGDGDVMTRFLPSFLAVELMRQGKSPAEAAEIAIRRIAKHHPKFFGAVIALNKNGEFSAACNGMDGFPFYASNLQLGKPTIFYVPCEKN